MLIEEIYSIVRYVLVFGGSAALVGVIFAPSQFLKVIHQETKESYTRIFKIYHHNGNYKAFFRGAHMYALRQFIINAVFGFSQYLYCKLCGYFFITHLFWIVFLQCFLGGVLETGTTILSEVEEIAKNKGGLMKRPARVTDVLTPLFIRNGITWLAAVLSEELTRKYMLGSISLNILLCGITGIIATALSMPFDLVATQSCGAADKMPFLVRMKKTLSEKSGFKHLFSGLKIRVIQNIAYTIVTSWAICFFKDS